MITRCCINEDCLNQFEVQKLSNKKKFCSSSCSAKFNNRNRPPRSQESKERTKQALKDSTKFRAYNSCLPKREASKICSACSITFLATRKPGRNFSIYCSAICREKGKRLKCRQIALDRGFGGYNNRTIEYDGVIFDSSWEVRIAQDLDLHGIKWERPTKFKLSSGQSYTPDFYLPDYHVYLDPKAYVKPDRVENTKERIALFEQDQSTICLVIESEENLTWSYIKNIIAPLDGVEPS